MPFPLTILRILEKLLNSPNFSVAKISCTVEPRFNKGPTFKLSDNLNLVALNFDAFSFNDFKNFRKIAEFTKF